jgi:beta-glucosidase
MTFMQHMTSLAALALTLSLGAVAAAHDGPAVSAMQSADANAALWPKASSPDAITSPETEAAIDALLAKMTLKQKVGQIVQADISAISPKDLRRYPLGSILAGGNSGPYGNERANAAQWQKLVTEFRKASRKSGAGVPILFGVDAVHGHSNLPGATIFPHNIGLGATRDPDLVMRIGKATAAEISGSGIEWTFAPTLAVPQDLRWGRTYEGYADDPALVASYARAMTKGLQGTLTAGQPLAAHQVAATAKHFLADGGTADGRDQGDARISEAELIGKHAQGYPAAIDAGALTVMASFSSWNGVKHHGNKTLLTDVLKGRMGFDGLIVGDWNGHGQIAGCAATNCPDAINAGLDLFMAPDSWKGLFDSTLAAVRDGRIPMARIDDAVRRIVRVKYKLGLMGKLRTQRGEAAQIGAAGHLEIAREAVAKSLVLLKNNDAVLPLRAGSRVLIAGPGADNMAMQAGGWTISWQGGDTKAADFPNGQTIGNAIADAVRAQGGQAVIASDGAFDTKPDVAVVVVGEKPYAEFEGDVPDLAFRMQSGEEALIAKLKSQGVRVVVLFLSGRPMFTGKLMNQADAFVAGWLPGTQGRGVADVLVAGADGTTSRDFTGRLPFAWPSDARVPVKNALFPAGYGLSYAQPTKLGPVNEEAGVDLSSNSNATHFVTRGKIPAPWRLDIDGTLSTRAMDISAQEDARQFLWTRDGTFAINGPAVDLTQAAAAGSSLMIEWRMDQKTTGPVRLSLGEATLDVTAIIGEHAAGAVVQTPIALRCFADVGTKLQSVSSVLRMTAPKGYAVTIRNIRIDAAQGIAPCPAAVK